MVIEPSPAALPTGGLFAGRYEVVRPLSAGGMGAVYEVVDRRNLRRRALKVMLPNLVSEPRLRERFEREATVTAAIESEHIVEVLDAGVDDATRMPYLAMELLRGVDLRVRLQREGRLPPSEVVLLLGQAALALERTHEGGVVHRDLKPDNLFVTTRDDGTPRLKILDFGIAKLVQPTGSAKTTGSVGTPLYMAPEQLKGDKDIGPACDLYALAHIAYTMLVGSEYWAEDVGEDGSVYPLLMKLVGGIREAPSARAARRGVTLPPAFDAWFLAATAADPRARPEGAHRMVTALAAALGVEAPPQPSGRSGPVALPGIDPTARTVDATPALEELRRASAPSPTPARDLGPASALTPSVRTEPSPGSAIQLPLRRSPLLPIVAAGALVAAAIAAVVLWRSSAAARPGGTVATSEATTATTTHAAPIVAPAAITATAPAEPVETATATPSAPAPRGDARVDRAPLPVAPAAPPPVAVPTAAPPPAPQAPGTTPRRRQAGPDDPGF